jgi:hypothetical protein
MDVKISWACEIQGWSTDAGAEKKGSTKERAFSTNSGRSEAIGPSGDKFTRKNKMKVNPIHNAKAASTSQSGRFIFF